VIFKLVLPVVLQLGDSLARARIQQVYRVQGQKVFKVPPSDETELQSIVTSMASELTLSPTPGLEAGAGHDG